MQYQELKSHPATYSHSPRALQNELYFCPAVIRLLRFVCYMPGECASSINSQRALQNLRSFTSPHLAFCHLSVIPSSQNRFPQSLLHPLTQYFNLEDIKMSQWVDPTEIAPQQPPPSYHHQQSADTTANIKVNETITIVEVHEPNRVHVVHHNDDDLSLGCCIGCMTAVCCCGCVMMWGLSLGIIWVY